jgi:GNAT superfamily N-acetyltransferase
MHEAKIRVAQSNEIGKVAAMMTLAFSGDPFMRWMYPEADAFLAHFPKFVEAFAGAAFRQKTAFVDESFGGACMWLPPGTEVDIEALGQHVVQTILPERLAEIGETFKQMEEHHVDEEAWYLPMIGVDANFQGQGIGARLMDSLLTKTDAMGIPTYLESSNPANIPFYKRLGYEAVGKIQFSSDSPIITPMHRANR